MIALPLFRRALGDSWRATLGWTAGFVGGLVMYAGFYPTIAEGNGEMLALLDSFPPELIAAMGLGQLATGAGYVQATFFALIGFAVITIASSAWGAGAIAGDEENGPLELTLAHGVTRTQLVLERSAAMGARLLVLGVASFVILVATQDAFGLDLKPANVLAVVAALVGLGCLSGSVALAVGAITGRPSWAVGAGAAVAIAGYTLNAIANQGADFEGLHAFSPVAWAYQNSPLIDGVDWAGLGLLYGFSALAVAIGLVVFQRRDVGV